MKSLVLSFFMLLSFKTFATESGLVIQNATIRIPPPAITTTAMFLKITNKSSQDVGLLKVSGDFAGNFELHTMEMAGGKMKMRPLNMIEVKKKSSVELQSGGMHIMIFNVKKPLKAGEIYKVKMLFNNKQEIEVDAKVI